MYVGALDIGGTKTIVAVIDEYGKVYGKERISTITSDCYAHLERCLEVLRGILKNLGADESELSGIGVTLPGIVDSKEGKLIFAPYEKWENIPVASFLSERFRHLDVFCENDVNACAVGEQMFGLGKKYKNYIWMTVSTGVGGAVVNDSELVKGLHGFAGELGHLKVEYEEPELCPCGQYGCLEAHGSGTAIQKSIQKKIKEKPEFEEAFRSAEVRADAFGCAALAKAGNEMAKKIFWQAGVFLGRGISYCANILNPDAVILGGGVAESLELLLPGIQYSVEKNTFYPMQDFVIERTALGYEAALLGAAALVLRERDGDQK